MYRVLGKRKMSHDRQPHPIEQQWMQVQEIRRFHRLTPYTVDPFCFRCKRISLQIEIALITENTMSGISNETEPEKNWSSEPAMQATPNETATRVGKVNKRPCSK